MKETTNIRYKLTNRMQTTPAEHIKQAVIRWLDIEDGNLESLEQILPSTQEEKPDREELSPAEKAAAYRKWAESHRRGLPLLSDETISRESIYSNECL